MRPSASCTTRGLTKIEVLAIIFVLVILVVMMLPALHRSRCGAQQLKDKTQIVQTHMGLLRFAADHHDLYPTPGLIQPIREGSLSRQDFSLNHSAPLYSYLIGANLVAPELLVTTHWECGSEVNPGVRAKKDYNYNAYNPALNRFWDPTFLMRIDDPKIGANCSYAHLAICGERRDLKWRSTAGAGVPIIGDRGTRGGATSGPEFTRSPTLRRYAPKDLWNGHICFADGHTNTLNSFFYPSVKNGEAEDNIYAAEFAHPQGNQAAADAFLGVFTGSTELTVNDVYDPLD